MSPLLKRRSAPPAPTGPSQDEQRERRRRRLSVEYTSAFDLGAEVDAICTPLAERVAAMRGRHLVEAECRALVTAVHSGVDSLSRQGAMREVYARTAHLPESDRITARRALLDALDGPSAPAVTVESLADGSWAGVLVGQAGLVAGVVSARLGEPPALRGEPWPQKVLAALRPVDDAALVLVRRLEGLEREARERDAREQARPPSAREQALKLLAGLGVEPLDVLGGGERR